MTKETPTTEAMDAFWRNHQDPTQAAVHLALQWLAYVYPASEMQIDRTLKSALPYADTDLSSRWAQYLDEHDVEQHVEVLEWMTEHLSVEQIPFLVETCWRLLLVDHELPAHVPLALRILGQVLKIEEGRLYDIGENVDREYVDADPEHKRAPLLPIDPRYLDRIEWRLYGANVSERRAVVSNEQKNRSGLIGFGWGSAFGALVVVGLVFGPLQLGRIKVPVMTHQYLSEDNALYAPVPETAPITPSAESAPVVTETPTQAAEPIVPDPLPEAIETTAATTEPVTDDVVETVEAPVTTPAATVTSAGDERVLMTVTASILNVRASADVNSDIVIKLAGGAKVWAYPARAEGLWMFLRVEDVEGYASARFLAEDVAP